tara:strand:+ start:146 stop:685 length:540 start_codon:yes stop_codon:yes gene_type:complete
MPELPQWASMKVEPKRKFKFILVLGDVPAWVVKTAGRPTIKVSETPHQWLGYEFKFPGRVTYEPIEVTLVDPIDPDMSKRVLNIIQEAGYIIPDKWGDTSPEDYKQTLSKRRFTTGKLRDVKIQSLDSNGRIVEEWVLRNAYLSQLVFDDLDYGSEDLVNIKLTIGFDFAILNTFPREE